MSDPMEEIAALRDRVAKVAEDLGLELQAFFVVPGEDGVPDRAQAVFDLDPEIAFVDDATREMNREFEAIARDFAVDDRETKALDARAELAKHLKDLKSTKGIGLDEDAA